MWDQIPANLRLPGTVPSHGSWKMVYRYPYLFQFYSFRMRTRFGLWSLKTEILAKNALCYSTGSKLTSNDLRRPFYMANLVFLYFRHILSEIRFQIIPLPPTWTLLNPATLYLNHPELDLPDDLIFCPLHSNPHRLSIQYWFSIQINCPGMATTSSDSDMAVILTSFKKKLL